MNVKNKPAGETINRKVEFTRVLNAPRELVFKAWTDAGHLAQWWGPRGFTNPVCRADARPGGEIFIEMRAPDGIVYPMSGVFIEVVEPERIVFSNTPLDENGKPMFEVFTTVTFTENMGKTTLKVTAVAENAPKKAEPMLDGMEEGWSQSLVRLDEHLMKTTKGK